MIQALKNFNRSHRGKYERKSAKGFDGSPSEPKEEPCKVDQIREEKHPLEIRLEKLSRDLDELRKAKAPAIETSSDATKPDDIVMKTSSGAIEPQKDLQQRLK